MIDFPTSPETERLHAATPTSAAQDENDPLRGVAKLSTGIVELAERIEGHVCFLANMNMNISLGSWGSISNDLLAAATALRAIGHAPTPSEPHEATYLRGWNEAIEHCASLCDRLRRKDYSMENADWVAGTSDCADAIRALSDTSTDRTIP